MIKYRKKLLIFHLSPIRYRYIETPISKVPIRYRYSDIGNISTIFSLYRPTSESYTRQSAGDSRSSTRTLRGVKRCLDIGHPRSVIYVAVYVPSYITRRALNIKAAGGNGRDDWHSVECLFVDALSTNFTIVALCPRYRPRRRRKSFKQVALLSQRGRAMLRICQLRCFYSTIPRAQFFFISPYSV